MFKWSLSSSSLAFGWWVGVWLSACSREALLSPTSRSPPRPLRLDPPGGAAPPDSQPPGLGQDGEAVGMHRTESGQGTTPQEMAPSLLGSAWGTCTGLRLSRCPGSPRAPRAVATACWKGAGGHFAASL